MRSRSKSARLRPRLKLRASCAASSMCWSRTVSFFGILHFTGAEHLITKVPAQLCRRAEVHLALQQLR